MILTKIKQKLTHYMNSWARSGNGNRSLLKETRLITGLIIILFFMLVLSLTFGSPKEIFNDLFPGNNQQNTFRAIGAGEINPTFRDIPWEVNIPENFNLKENDSYETDEFGIFYNNVNQTYYVNFYEGDEYTFDELKAFIQTKVLVRILDFNSLVRIPRSMISYNDYRGGYMEEFDLETFELNP